MADVPSNSQVRPAVVHDLKTDSGPFWDLGRKKLLELRRDDRGYEVGDLLRLREHDRVAGEYLGGITWARVAHVQRGYGLQPGYVALSLDFDVIAPPEWRCDGGCHERGQDDCPLCSLEPERCCDGCLGGYA